MANGNKQYFYVGAKIKRTGELLGFVVLAENADAAAGNCLHAYKERYEWTEIRPVLISDEILRPRETTTEHVCTRPEYKPKFPNLVFYLVIPSLAISLTTIVLWVRSLLMK